MKSLIFVIFIGLILGGCQSSIETCDCTQIDVYAGSRSLLPFFPLTTNSYNRINPVIIGDSSEIQNLLNELSTLDLEDSEFHGYSHYLLKLHCKFKNSITVEIDKHTIQIDHSVFTTSDKFYSIMENYNNEFRK